MLSLLKIKCPCVGPAPFLTNETETLSGKSSSGDSDGQVWLEAALLLTQAF